MQGSVLPLVGVDNPHRWIRDLNIMRVRKIGLWSPSSEGGDPELNKFFACCNGEIPFHSFLVAYLGFSFRPVGMLFRDLETKDFRTFVMMKKFKFYVSQSFDNRYKEFKHGNCIVLLEGIVDAEAFSYLTGYPWVIAYLRSWIGPHLAAFIASLTDKVLVVPDNDPAGHSGYPKIFKNLTAFGVKVEKLDVTSCKDFGDVFDNGLVNEVQKANMVLKWKVG
jgi:hypothetical protein